MRISFDLFTAAAAKTADIDFSFKPILGILLAVCALRAWQTGYFRALFSYFRSWTLRRIQVFHFLLFILIVLIIMRFFDQPVLNLILAYEDNPVLSTLTYCGGLFGKNINFWAFMSLIYLGLSLNPAWRKAAHLFFGMMLTSALAALVVHGLKFIFLRTRPYGEHGPFSFFNWTGLTENRHVFQSLASGDVALVAGASGYLFYAIRNRYWRWLVLLIPISTALSRIVHEKHWPSDTAASIAISMLIARFVWAYQKIKI